MAALLFALALASAPKPSCPDARATVEVNECLNEALKGFDGEMKRYYEAAVKRLKAEQSPAANDAVSGLVRAQEVWRAYSDAECGALHDYWREGTIRTSFELECRIRLTRLRTFSLWRDWLTYPDSTPVILPRPDLDDLVSEREH
ncbi:lysozyme inhibitor LprI family protein [Caulobacter sp.]|uniref:lysozyme inhibitor LprI family protein n=1 Tax=Caulobacter sp. TaxID=78 RepID=UPI002B45E608|nr:lysozyme inhibitor LprI family protein [Caulobacter sp.]HJV40505.1 lysozyme inhibitor LprI family protein [Caulobacter sp.]